MLTPTEYQQEAIRTEVNHASTVSRLQHALLGMQSELGELSKEMIKWLYYGKDADTTKMEEELGDIAWHLAQFCTAIGFNLEIVMKRNLDKLRIRFPEKFCPVRVERENRDLQAEGEVFKS